MNKRNIIFSRIAWFLPVLILICLFFLGIINSYISMKESVEKSNTKVLKEGVAIVENKPSDEYLGQKEFENDLYIKENGVYISKEELAAYINLYKKLPNNYISKKEAYIAGWEVDKDNLDTVLPGMSIGGDEFGNFDNKLPSSPSRIYYEADVDYMGGARNSKRIVYSNDGLIFYTEDSYENFERLY